MYNEIVTLIADEQQRNEIGDLTSVEKRRDVFAEVRSVGMKEKYQAFAAGLNPEWVFVLADYLEYANETKLEFESQQFSIFRTYRKGSNELEIVAVR